MDRLDSRRVAVYLARARVGMGLALLVAPRLVGRAWIGDPADSRGARVFGRAMGARDVALGAGAAIALGERSGGGDWLSMGAVVDGVDAVVSVLARGVSWRARVVGLWAAGSAAAHLMVARELAAAERALPTPEV